VTNIYKSLTKFFKKK